MATLKLPLATPVSSSDLKTSASRYFHGTFYLTYLIKIEMVIQSYPSISMQSV